MTASDANAEVVLPELIADHMVLQRDTRLTLWGWASHGEPIAIRFHGTVVRTTTDARGRWTVHAGPFPAGGPFDLVIDGKDSRRVVHDILLGDVWIASGQSNMEFPLKPGAEEWMSGVPNGDEEAKERFPRMRLFKVPRTLSFQPQQGVPAAEWSDVTSDSVAGFSAIAYFFGRELHQRYHVPIGLLQASWGGTPAEAWVSREGLAAFPEFGDRINQISETDERVAREESVKYAQETSAWNARHRGEDQGEVGGQPLWAAPDLDTSSWTAITEPQTTAQSALKGFDGVVWFRRELSIPVEEAASPARVYLSTAGKSDTTYLNGVEIGHTEAWDTPRDYRVPSGVIHPGRNVLTIRMSGADGYVGMFDWDHADKLLLELGKVQIPLGGSWLYHASTNVSDHPIKPLQARLALDPSGPTVLFNGMINPLTRFQIKGVIWYQGESNASDHRAHQYRTLFPALIRDWRRQWTKNFPFLYVQLAGFGYNQAEPADYAWADLREAQGLALKLPATAMASAVDLGEQDSIHPRDKAAIAHRLVLAARSVAYGEHLIHSGPRYRSMRVDGSQLRLTFFDSGGALVVHDPSKRVRGFEIAGDDGQFRWADAQIKGASIVVSHPSIPRPIAVRYGWRNMPDGNVFNQEGLPMLPFRIPAP